MSAEGEFAKPSKKVGRKPKPFNQRKEIWLVNKLYNEEPHSEEDIRERLTKLPLKYRALSTLVREASNADLLIMKRIFDDELSLRPQPVEIVLKREQHEAASDWGRDIYNELGRIIAKDYVEERFPDLDKKTRRRLATYLYWNIELYPEEEPPKKKMAENTSEYQKLLDDYNKRLEEERMTREKIAEELINVLGEERLDTINEDFQEAAEAEEAEEAGEEGEFSAYYSDKPDNPYLIRVLKNLERRKVKVETMLLYTLELPLGASYEIGFDAKYGEYPIITGC